MMRVRVAALVVQDGRVLLARHVKAGRSTFLLPGGGLEADENAHEALARELREEAGTGCTIGELRYVVEANAPDQSRHILQLVFAASLDGDVGSSSDERVAECGWHAIGRLHDLPIYPAIGAEIAQDLERAGPRPCRYLLVDWRE